MSRQIPRTEEGRVSLVVEGATIASVYGAKSGMEPFWADLKVLVERPTVDAYMAACRANRWRTAELRAHGIEPLDLTKLRVPANFPPENFDFGHGPATDIAFLLSVIDSCDEAGAPSCEMEPEDVANIARIRAAYP